MNLLFSKLVQRSEIATTGVKHWKGEGGAHLHKLFQGNSLVPIAPNDATIITVGLHWCVLHAYERIKRTKDIPTYNVRDWRYMLVYKSMAGKNLGFRNSTWRGRWSQVRLARCAKWPWLVHCIRFNQSLSLWFLLVINVTLFPPKFYFIQLNTNLVPRSNLQILTALVIRHWTGQG